MAHCTVCTAELPENAKFCPNCGERVAGGSTKPANASAAYPPGTRPGTSTTATSTATTPLTRAAVGDYLRDVLAGLALIFSLFMVWISAPAVSAPPVTALAAARIDVLLITLLSLASLAIPHLGRSGVFGPHWGPARAHDLRLLAAVPYGVLVVVYVVIALVSQLTLGPALAFGLAGAILAAQPRRSELIDEDARRGERWTVITAAIAGFCVLLALVQIAEMFAVFSTSGPGAILLSIVLGLAGAALLAATAGGILAGHRTWQRIAVGIGIAGAVFSLLALSPQLTLVNSSLHGPTPAFSLIFWIAFGAAASAPSVQRRLAPAADAGAEWTATARAATTLAIAAGALVAVVSVIELVRRSSVALIPAALGTAEWTVSLLVGLVVLAAGIVAYSLARAESRIAVHALSLYACLLFALGLVLVVIWSVPAALPSAGVATLAPLIAFALPAGIAGALWLPSTARARYASLPRTSTQRPQRDASAEPAAQYDPEAQADRAPETTAQAARGAEPGDPTAATTTASGAGATGTGATDASAASDAGAASGAGTPSGLDELHAEAADPATRATRLHELAALVPEVRVDLAANPSTYPSLLEWLSRLDDPAVNAALAARDDEAQPARSGHHDGD